jgi:uncharacterized membrane protein
MVMEWYEMHKEELMQDWELCAKRDAKSNKTTRINYVYLYKISKIFKRL